MYYFRIHNTESIDFINDSTVSFLIGGGDIAHRTNYYINDDKIIFENSDFVNYNVSFNIQNRRTLNRIEDNEIWEKD